MQIPATGRNSKSLINLLFLDSSCPNGAVLGLFSGQLNKHAREPAACESFVASSKLPAKGKDSRRLSTLLGIFKGRMATSSSCLVKMKIKRIVEPTGLELPPAIVSVCTFSSKFQIHLRHHKRCHRSHRKIPPAPSTPKFGLRKESRLRRSSGGSCGESGEGCSSSRSRGF